MTIKNSTKTIVFIHGLFMNPNSWGDWVVFFQSKGYTCYVPPYPYHDGSPQYLRENINPHLNDLTLGDVIKSLVTFIDKLPEPPILIGHSMGGLIVQKLLELNKGVAGVCITPAPPRGIFSFKWSFLKSNFVIVNPFAGNSYFLPSLKWFQYSFFNTLNTEQARIAYDNFIVPESRNIPRSVLGIDGKINFDRQHQPLLFISGEYDNIVPTFLVRNNFEAYTDTNSLINFKEFSGRSHYICGEKNYLEVMEYIYKWITNLQ